MDAKGCLLYKTRMDYFGNLEIYRYNHLRDHDERLDRIFGTYAINYAHRGTLLWETEGEVETILEAPIAYWTWPGTRFRYRPIGEQPWEHYYVSFTGDRTRNWSAHGLMPTHIASPFLSISEPDVFRGAFENLLSLLGSQPLDRDRAVHAIEGLLLLLHRQPERESAHHPRRREVLDLMRQVADHPGTDVDFNHCAKRMGVTAAHLRKLFRLIAGCTPTRYVIRVRMNHAALLLRTTDLPVKHIAATVGVEDVYYFTKLFRRQHGLPPATYRRSFQRLGTG